MPYETQSQWTIDELKKLNKATLSFEIQKDEEKGLKVIGAIYRIEDGTVEFDV
jgi:hypothetical protein